MLKYTDWDSMVSRGIVNPINVGKGDSRTIFIYVGRLTIIGWGYLNGRIIWTSKRINWDKIVEFLE